MSKLVEHVSTKPLPPGKNYLIIEICCNRMSDDEDVDVPYVKYTLEPVCVIYFIFFFSLLVTNVSFLFRLPQHKCDIVSINNYFRTIIVPPLFIIIILNPRTYINI